MIAVSLIRPLPFEEWGLASVFQREVLGALWDRDTERFGVAVIVHHEAPLTVRIDAPLLGRHGIVIHDHRNQHEGAIVLLRRSADQQDKYVRWRSADDVANAINLILAELEQLIFKTVQAS